MIVNKKNPILVISFQLRQMKTIFPFLLFLSILFFGREAAAQKDTLILANKDILVGEVKGMDRGIVTIETDYSKEDFKVEWKGVQKIYTTTYYNITLKNGTRINGRLRSSTPGNIGILSKQASEVTFRNEELVYMKSVDDKFFERLHAAVDFGFSLTKSQNLKQVSIRSNVGYLSESWSADLTYNSIFSSQDDVDPIRRTDGGFSFNYFLPKDWYIPVSLTFLSNTEQKIDLRTLGKLGLGKYIIHTNHSYWGFAGGLSYNLENYADTPDRNSWEGYFGTEFNLYDLGDLSLVTKLVAYPSISESGRWRSDLSFDTKYDLPLDFYIKFGFTVNFDNRPVAGATEFDYVLQTGFGWKW